MGTYSDIVLKFAVGIIALIIQINILGKGNLAPISAMDQVQNYVLGGIIGGVIYNDTISVLQFGMVLIIWTILVLSLKIIKNYNFHVKSMIDGVPVVVIKKGNILMDNVLKAGLSANDLMFKLRNSGIDQIQKVQIATLEQNGQLTVAKYGEESIKYPLVFDGQINFDLLEVIDKDDVWLKHEISKQYPEKSINDVYLGEFINGNIVLHMYE
jgi:uncharacterized membrane protein YcaP (DUF421 family)